MNDYNNEFDYEAFANDFFRDEEKEQEPKYAGMVCFDYDGTLISENEGIFEMPESTKEALTLLRENGYLVTLSTGRSRLMSQRVAKYFDAFVLLNGAYIIVGDRVLRDKHLAEFEVQEIEQAMKECGVVCMYDGLDYCYTNAAEVPHMKELIRMLDIPDDWLTPWDEDATDPIYKFVISYGKEEDIQALMDRYDDSYFFANQPKFSYSDMNMQGINKGEGIELVLEHTGIAKEDSYAFGDSNNDCPMFEAVGTGIAMGNHTEELGKVADRIAPSVGNDGIYVACKELGLI